MKMKIKLTYNGFHGLNTVTLIVQKPKKTVFGFNLFNLELSQSQINKINRMVGCRTYTTIFGMRKPIQGACMCGEGIDPDQPIYAKKNGDNSYIIGGHYQQ